MITKDYGMVAACVGEWIAQKTKQESNSA